MKNTHQWIYSSGRYAQINNSAAKYKFRRLQADQFSQHNW